MPNNPQIIDGWTLVQPAGSMVIDSPSFATSRCGIDSQLVEEINLIELEKVSYEHKVSRSQTYRAATIRHFKWRLASV